MTGVKAQAEALLNGITPGEWRTYAHIDGTALYSARTPQPHEHFAEDEEPVHLIAENMGSVDAELCRNAPALARQVVELAEEVTRLRELEEAVRLVGLKWSQQAAYLQLAHSRQEGDAVVWGSNLDRMQWQMFGHCADELRAALAGSPS